MYYYEKQTLRLGRIDWFEKAKCEVTLQDTDEYELIYIYKHF